MYILYFTSFIGAKIHIYFKIKKIYHKNFREIFGNIK